MYRLTEQELHSLCDTGSMRTLDLSMFTLCAGALVTLLVTIKTIDIVDPKTHAEFVAGVIVSAIGAIFFGARGIIAWTESKRTLDRIKKADDA
jgi:hypothetical protein